MFVSADLAYLDLFPHLITLDRLRARQGHHGGPYAEKATAMRAARVTVGGNRLSRSSPEGLSHSGEFTWLD